MDRIEQAEENQRQRRLQSFRPILMDPKQSMLVAELVEAARKAGEIELDEDFSPKVELKKLIVKLSNATGAEGAQEAWNDIAALAVRMGDSVRPRLQRDTMAVKQPDRDTLVHPNADVLVH